MPIFHARLRKEGRCSKKNFYDAVLKKSALMKWTILEVCIFRATNRMGKGWRAGSKRFVIVMPLAGSCCHKVYPDMSRLYDILETLMRSYT